MNMMGRCVEDRFQLDQIVGEGGMSVVWKATDLVSQKQVAIKILNTESTDPKIRERFLREAESQAKIRSPHVVRIFHFGRDMEMNLLYIAMEYCDGDTLFRVLESGALPLDLGVEVSLQIAMGLKAAHDQEIIHRDVKPANIMLVPKRGELFVKLVDFGFVRVKHAARSLTQDGFVGGTLSYVSPEELELKTLDTRLDLYSFGCVLFEMFAGRPPFVAKTPQATAVMHLSSEPPRLDGADIPEEIKDLVAWLLQKDPDDRPATADVVIDVLERIRQALEIPKPAVAHQGRTSDPAKVWRARPDVSG